MKFKKIISIICLFALCSNFVQASAEYSNADDTIQEVVTETVSEELNETIPVVENDNSSENQVSQSSENLQNNSNNSTVSLANGTGETVEQNTNVIVVKRYDDTVAFKVKINRTTGKISVTDRDKFKVDEGLHETYFRVDIYNNSNNDGKPEKSIEVSGRDISADSAGLNELDKVTLTANQYIKIFCFYPEYVSIHGDIDKTDNKITEERYDDGIKDPDQLENVKFSISEDKNKLKLTYENKDLNEQVKNVITPLFENNGIYRSPFKIAINSVNKTFKVIDIKNQYVSANDGEDVVFKFKVFSKGGTEKVSLEVKGNEKATDIDFSELEKLTYEEDDRITMWVKDQKLYRIKGDILPENTSSNNTVKDYSQGILDNNLGFNYEDIMTRRGFKFTNNGLQELSNTQPTIGFESGKDTITVFRGSDYSNSQSESYILGGITINDEDDNPISKVTYTDFDDEQDSCEVTYEYIDSWGLKATAKRTVTIKDGMLRHTLTLTGLETVNVGNRFDAAEVKFNTDEKEVGYDGKLKVKLLVDENKDFNMLSGQYSILEILIYDENESRVAQKSLTMNSKVSELKDLNDINFKYGYYIKIKAFSEADGLRLSGYIKDAPEDFSNGAQNPANLQNYIFKITKRGLEAVKKNLDYNSNDGESLITIRNVKNDSNKNMAFFSIKIAPNDSNQNTVSIINAKNAKGGIPQFSIQLFDSHGNSKGNKVTTNTSHQPVDSNGNLTTTYQQIESFNICIGDYIEIWSSDLDGLEVNGVYDGREEFDDGIQDLGGAGTNDGEYQKYVRFEVTEEGLQPIYNDTPYAEYDDLIIYKKSSSTGLTIDEIKEGIVIKDPYYDYDNDQYKEYTYSGNYNENVDNNGIKVTVTAVNGNTTQNISTIDTSIIGEYTIRYTITEKDIRNGVSGRTITFDRKVRVVEDVERNLLEFKGTEDTGEQFTLFKIRMNSLTKRFELFDISEGKILDQDYSNDDSPYINLNLYGHVKITTPNTSRVNNNNTSTVNVGYSIENGGILSYTDINGNKTQIGSGYSTDNENYILKDGKKVVLKKGSFSLKGGQVLNNEIAALVGNVQFDYGDYITLYHAKLQNMVITGDIINNIQSDNSNIKVTEANDVIEDYSNGIDKPENMHNVAFKITVDGIEAVKYDKDKENYKNVITAEFPKSIPFKIMFDESDSKVKVVEQTNEYLSYEDGYDTVFVFKLLSKDGTEKCKVELYGGKRGNDEQFEKLKEGIEYQDGDQIVLYSKYPETLKFKTDNIINNLEDYSDGFQFIKTIDTSTSIISKDSEQEGIKSEGISVKSDTQDTNDVEELPASKDKDSSVDIGKNYTDSMFNIRFKIKKSSTTIGPSTLITGDPNKPLVFETIYNTAPEVVEDKTLVIQKDQSLDENALKEKLMEGLTIKDDHDEYKKNNGSNNSNKGSIEVEINHNIDINKVGYYEATYTVRDSWGAQTEFIRKIVVKGNIESNKIRLQENSNSNNYVDIGFDLKEKSQGSSYSVNADLSNKSYDGKLTLERGSDGTIVSLSKEYVAVSITLYDKDGKIKTRTLDDGAIEEIKYEKTKMSKVEDIEFDVFDGAEFEFGDYLSVFTFNSIKTAIKGDIINAVEGESYDTGITNDFNLKSYKYKITEYGLEAVLDSQDLVGFDNANIISPTFTTRYGTDVRTAFSLRVEQVENTSDETSRTGETGDIKIRVINPQEIQMCAGFFSDIGMRIVIKDGKTDKIKYAASFDGYFTPVAGIVNGAIQLNTHLKTLEETKINHGDILVLWSGELNNLKILGNVNGSPRKDFAQGLDEFGDLTDSADSEDTTISTSDIGTGKASFWNYTSYVRFKFTENGLEVMYNDAPDIVIEDDINLKPNETYDILENVTVEDDRDKDLSYTVDNNNNVTVETAITNNLNKLKTLARTGNTGGGSQIPPIEVTPTTTKIYTATTTGMDTLTYRTKDSWGRKTVLTRNVTVTDNQSTGLINNSITYFSKDENGNRFYPFKIIFDDVNKKIKVTDRKRKVIDSFVQVEDYITLSLYNSSNQLKKQTIISSWDQGFSKNVNEFDNIPYEDGDYIKISAFHPLNIIINGDVEGADNSPIKTPRNNNSPQQPDNTGQGGNSSNSQQNSNAGSTSTNSIDENYRDGVNEPYNLYYVKFVLNNNKLAAIKDPIPRDKLIFNPIYKHTLNYYPLKGEYKIAPFKLYFNFENNTIDIVERNNTPLNISTPNKLMFNLLIMDGKTNKIKVDIKLFGSDSGQSWKLDALKSYSLKKGDLIKVSSSENETFRILGSIENSVQDSYVDGINKGEINNAGYYELLFRVMENGIKEESKYPSIVRDNGVDKVVVLEKNGYQNTLEDKDRYLRSLVMASDLVHGDITNSIKYEAGNFDPTQTGTYTVTYTVTNKDGYSSSITQIIQVVKTINVSLPADPVKIEINNDIDGNKTISSEEFIINNHSTSSVEVFVEDLVQLPSSTTEIIDVNSHEFKTLNNLYTIKRIAVGLYTGDGFIDSDYTTKEKPLWLTQYNMNEQKLGTIKMAPNLKQPAEGKVKLAVQTADNMIIGRSNGIFDLRLIFR